jgi:hypothetical protein
MHLLFLRAPLRLQKRMTMPLLLALFSLLNFFQRRIFTQDHPDGA